MRISRNARAAAIALTLGGRFALTVYEGVARGKPAPTLRTGLAERALDGPRLALGAHGRAVLAWGTPAPKRPGTRRLAIASP
jgi:hypothetical protein